MESLTEARQKSFEEVSQDIMRELTQKKSEDVRGELIQRLMDKFGVIIHQSKFLPQEVQGEGQGQN